jgi:hypothetical protein
VEQKNPHVHQVHFPIFSGNSSNNFGFGIEPHNHFSSPGTLNVASQEFKQRSSEGNNNSGTYNGLQHSHHNQSESTIKTKNFDSELNPNVQNHKVSPMKV